MKDSDPIRQMKKHIETLLALDLQSPNQEEIDVGVDAFEHLNDLCFNLDNATGWKTILPAYFEMIML